MTISKFINFSGPQFFTLRFKVEVIIMIMPNIPTYLLN